MTRRQPGVDHMGLTVRSLARSVAFYRDFIGMDVVYASDTVLGGKWFDTLTSNEGAQILVATLALGHFNLQLIEYRAAGHPPTQLDHSSPGTPHLCVRVDDVEARHLDARQRGFQPTPLVAHVLFAGQSFYVDDPDGVPVELLQVDPPDRHRADLD